MSSLKTKTIALVHGFRQDGMSMSDPPGYQVQRVTDSLEYTPGQIITKAQAAELCAARDWKVIVQKNV